MNYENIPMWKNQFEEYLKNHPSNDGSHDIYHFKRVWRVATSLTTGKEDLLVILAACYFHDIVNYPKDSPKRSVSSLDASLKTKEILENMNFPKEKISNVCHCIEAHSFSANINTKTPEAQIVQDADRMESLGAIGLARTFYVAGRMGSKIFCGEDPFAKRRDLDDMTYAIDHFKKKLFKIPPSMKTDKGKIEAQKRAKFLQVFLSELESELIYSDSNCK